MRVLSVFFRVFRVFRVHLLPFLCLLTNELIDKSA